jgi:AcrR family transcriptional regulator
VVHFFVEMAYRHTDKTLARKAQVRENIAAAGLEQVAEGGYQSASVQAVANRAGVATGTVYRHFPSKADLFAEVFRRATEREVDVVAGLLADRERPASERIAAAIDAFARRALAGPVLAYALIAEPVDPAVEAERLSYRHAYRDVFAAALKDGIESGELRPHDTDVAAAALVGALAEALVGPLSPGASNRRRAEALVAGVVQFCLGGIAAEHAVDRPVAA